MTSSFRPLAAVLALIVVLQLPAASAQVPLAGVEEPDPHASVHEELPSLSPDEIDAGLGSDDPEVQGRALLAAERAGPAGVDRVLDRILALLAADADEGAYELRGIAVHVLGQSSRAEALDALFRVMVDESDDGTGEIAADALAAHAAAPEVARRALAAASAPGAPAGLYGLYLLCRLDLRAWGGAADARAAAVLPVAEGALAADDPDVVEVGVHLVRTLAPDRAVDLLKPHLGGEYGWRFARALAEVGSPAAVDALLATLSEGAPLPRAWCASALVFVPGPADPRVIDALGARLSDPDGRVRSLALSSLTRLGAGARFTGPALERLREGDTDERRAAVGLLGSVSPVSSEVVAALATTVAGDPPCREEAVQALGRLGPAAAEAVPALMEVLRITPPGDHGMSSRVLEALGEIGPAAADAVPLMVERLAGLDLSVWGPLARIGQAALPHLLPLLEGSRRTRPRVAWLFGEGGERLAAAAPALRAALEREVYPEARHYLEVALASVTGATPPEVEWVSAPEGPHTTDGRGPTALRFGVRPGGRARTFYFDASRRSALTESLVRDWDAYAVALAAAMKAFPGEDRHRWVLFDHLRPELPVWDPEELDSYLYGWLCRQPLERLVEHQGEPLFLGDLVQTGEYRGVWTLIVTEREGPDGGHVLALSDPWREEYYVTPPSYLRVPTVVPSLRFWDDGQVELAPIDHAWALERLDGDVLVIGDRRFELEPEHLEALRDPSRGLQLYVHLQEDFVWLHRPEDVDRSPPVGR